MSVEACRSSPSSGQMPEDVCAHLRQKLWPHAAEITASTSTPAHSGQVSEGGGSLTNTVGSAESAPPPPLCRLSAVADADSGRELRREDPPLEDSAPLSLDGGAHTLEVLACVGVLVLLCVGRLLRVAWLAYACAARLRVGVSACVWLCVCVWGVLAAVDVRAEINGTGTAST
jgi:hypothetical protein